MHWFPSDGLRDVSLYPSFLREALCSLPALPQHVVTNETFLSPGKRRTPDDPIRPVRAVLE
jgi:hypothetical protein